VVIDMDPTDDPTHGQQQLSLFHGYYDQHQYFPMLIFEGETGLPLGAWLRPGAVGAGCGAVEMLDEIVQRLRQHWPEVTIVVRGDCGLAGPEMYEYCEQQRLLYTFGYSTNEVLKRRVSDLELEDNARLLWHINGWQPVQLFHVFEDYRAGTWSRARRIVTKVEVTRTGGVNTRYVVTNMSGNPSGIYRGFYVQRGNVPERPINELKNGLQMDRLSSPRFLANDYKLLVHVLAYLLWVLFREANAATPELQTMEVGTARTRLFKVGAVVKATHRRIWFHLASHWPGMGLLQQAAAAVKTYIHALHQRWRALKLFVEQDVIDARFAMQIHFAPQPP
jgi:hypothetical protein